MRRVHHYLLLIVCLLTDGFLLPEDFRMPVVGASRADYNQASFWYHPWGKSGVHKGVDIFAADNTPVQPAVSGIVIYTGKFKRGGNVVLVLGPKWRVHYYAHLSRIDTDAFSIVGEGDNLGRVGTTGNAAGKPPHLHYAIFSLLPYWWLSDDSPQGVRKMWYLDPVARLNEL
ncbi:M23 family metallopeptidase [Roseivirga sp. BDSF3-8]|uniref:M23 family metallopeptidase n=1 Tax=Roseivirga sp. BDSF3-8 TaxID=3241598 RepID=UPI00353182C6